MIEQKYGSLISAFPSHPQSSGQNGRTGHLTTTYLSHAETQDCLSRIGCSVNQPVWQRSLHSTQRLPVMGLAARGAWTSQGISRSNTCESQTLGGRETALEAPNRQL